MRKIVQGILAVLAISAVLFGIRYQLEHAEGYTGDKVINFYNWGEYIDPELLKEFEAETGYKVIYETFDSNEAMMAKIRQGGTPYDITVPSEYMIQEMMKEGMVLPLDHSKLSNLQHLDQRFLNLDFDPGNKYSVPYFWGTLGIVYDTSKYSEEDFQSWNDLWRNGDWPPILGLLPQ